MTRRQRRSARQEQSAQELPPAPAQHVVIQGTAVKLNEAMSLFAAQADEWYAKGYELTHYTALRDDISYLLTGVMQPRKEEDPSV